MHNRVLRPLPGLILLLALSAITFGQSLPCKCYGVLPNSDEQSLAVVEASDGGYVMGGLTTAGFGGDTNLLIFKVDTAGAFIWARTNGAGPTGTDVVTSIAGTPDRRYVAAGWTTGFGLYPNAADVFLTKFDSAGNTLWSRTYGRPAEDRAYSVVATADSGFAITGWSDVAGSHDIFIIKTDSAGITLWSRNYTVTGGTYDEEAASICEIPGSPPRLAVCGRFMTGGVTAALLFTVESDGTPTPGFQPVITINNAYPNEAWSVAYDGSDLAVAGWSQNFSVGGPPEPNVMVWRINSATGAPVWTRVYGWQEGEEKAMDDRCLVADDAGYTISGWTKSKGPGTPDSANFLIVRVGKATGDVLWSRIHPSLPGEGDERASAIARTSVGYAVVGRTNSHWSTGRYDAHFVTLDAAGNRPVCVLDSTVLTAPMGVGTAAVTDYLESYDTLSLPLVQFGLTAVNVCSLVVQTGDAGVIRVIGPTFDVPLDSGAVVTPACSVYNYGTTTITFPVTLSIGALYTESVTVSTLFPSTGQRVDFPAATADWPRGKHIVLARTGLSGDADTTNDIAHDSVFITVRDVGVAAILAPTGVIDSIQTVTPRCSVYNAGNTAETLTVHFTLANFDASQTVTLPGETGQQVSFGSFAQWPRGNWTATCSTIVAGDMAPDNNVLTVPIRVRVRDVACFALLQPVPAAVYDSGTVIAPECSVTNYGTDSADFDARMTIGSDYDQTLAVASLAPGASALVGPFPNWNAHPVGIVRMFGASSYNLDMAHRNDSLSDRFVVRRPGGHDVGVLHILVPAGVVDSGATVTPACSLFNFGADAETYRVRLRVGTLYNDTAHVTAHASGTFTYVQFPSWTTAAVGNFAVTCSTELEGDDTPADDRRMRNVVLARPGPDFACLKILMPTGSIPVGTVTAPACSTWNFGHTTSYRLRLRIGSLYDTFVNVSGHAPGTSRIVNLPTWTAWPTGPIYTTAFTTIAGDLEPRNDTARGEVMVLANGLGAWDERAPMPLENSQKPAGDGAWLTYYPVLDRFYVNKGNKTNDFYYYNPLPNQWIKANPFPAGAEDRLPRKGSAGCNDSSRFVYATKGNNTSTFWRYDIPSDTWHQLASVPLGVYRKKVKGGTDVAYVDVGQPYVYLLKGYNNEFYRYDIGADTWLTLDPVPAGGRNKVEPGSFLVYDDGTSLYAHKSKVHELWRFDLVTQRWDTAHKLDRMPLTNRFGRSRRSRDGGCGVWYADNIFALKGANSQDFFRYLIASDTWYELDTIPSYSQVTGRTKRVKNGGDIASRGDGELYALKGNKSRELWRYLVAPSLLAGDARAARDGIMANGRLAIDDCQLSIAPNPMSGSRVLHLTTGALGHSATVAIYDALGRTILHQSLGISHSSLPLDLRALPAGVYLVRLRTDGFTATRKLVIER